MASTYFAVTAVISCAAALLYRCRSARSLRVHEAKVQEDFNTLSDCLQRWKKEDKTKFIANLLQERILLDRHIDTKKWSFFYVTDARGHVQAIASMVFIEKKRAWGIDYLVANPSTKIRAGVALIVHAVHLSQKVAGTWKTTAVYSAVADKDAARFHTYMGFVMENDARVLRGLALARFMQKYGALI